MHSVDLRLVKELVHDMQSSSPSMVAPRIVSLNPFTLEDVLHDALIMGKQLGLEQQAATAVAALQQRIATARSFVAQQPPLRNNVVSGAAENLELRVAVRLLHRRQMGC